MKKKLSLSLFAILSLALLGGMEAKAAESKPAAPAVHHHRHHRIHHSQVKQAPAPTPDQENMK